jgi:hypothetical protein
MKKSLLQRVIEQYQGRQRNEGAIDECPALNDTPAGKTCPEMRDHAYSMQDKNGGPISRSLFMLTPEAVTYATLCEGMNIGYLYAKMEAEEAAKAAVN